MLGRLGEVITLLGLAAAVAGGVTGYAAGRTGSHALLRATQRLSMTFTAAMLTIFVVMEVALVRHDFSVSYVAKVGSTKSPLYVTIVSLWSSLEGSIILWGAVLGIFVAVFTYWSRDRHPETTPWALGTMLWICAFFAFLIAGPANPFSPTPLPIPDEGPGPNPLLQNHVLMIIHPPMLYLGYVGMTVPFGMAIGALLAGQLGPAWTQALRKALLIPWGFLTVGIILGGWWAYAVLGWGGYWAWDPVENASFLPWLTATAALHAAMLPSRRDTMKGWTVVLVLITFLLTLLGTFMTRSGVFNSVHSFTQSDIGPIFLIFLAFCLVGCVLLLAARIDRLAGEGDAPHPISRETGFLLNNLLLVALSFTVLVGTTYPLIIEAVNDTRLSVGEPYFNRVAMPIGITLLFLMGVGPALPWGEASNRKIMQALGPPGAASVAVAALGWAGGIRTPWPLVLVATAGFATYVTVREMVTPVLVRMRENKESPLVALSHAFERGRRRYGGYVVHLGIIVLIVAIGISHAYRRDQEFSINTGEAATFGDYTFRLVGVESLNEAHRQREVVTVDVTGPGGPFTLKPALNNYSGAMNAIGSPDVRSLPTLDVYVSVLSIGTDRVGLHVYLNPAVGWLWIGMGIVIVGTVLAAWPARRSGAVGAPIVEAPS